MKKLSFFVTLVLSLWMAGSAVGAEPARSSLFRGFSGGMMFHTGWICSGRMQLSSPSGGALPVQEIQGMPYGLGGSLRLHFGNHLRVGGEGYGTYLDYGPYGSRIGIGWGGVSADFQWSVGRFYPYAGLTVGGGAVRNLTLTHPSQGDFVTETDASYRRYGFLAAVPFIGVEFALNSRVHLVMKADWMVNVSNPQPDFPSGPRIYIGFIFCHLRNR